MKVHKQIFKKLYSDFADIGYDIDTVFWNELHRRGWKDIRNPVQFETLKLLHKVMNEVS